MAKVNKQALLDKINGYFDNNGIKKIRGGTHLNDYLTDAIDSFASLEDKNVFSQIYEKSAPHCRGKLNQRSQSAI